MQDERKYRVRILIEPAPDTPGQWVSHCLDFDVVSQGNDPLHALQMVLEAARIVILDDLEQGLDPHGRREAPEEDWDRLYNIMRVGKSIGTPDPSQVDELSHGYTAFAAQCDLRFVRIAPDETSCDYRVVFGTAA